jgi:RNA polymerase sigma-70 factor (ECF subfamily)
MAAHDSFTELMTRLRAGEDAATEVFERYAQRLHGLARRHLDTVLKRKVDPEDVVQSAYKSFFFRYGDGTLEVRDWDNLMSVDVQDR